MKIKLSRTVLFCLIALVLVITGAIALTLRGSFQSTNLVHGFDASKNQLKNVYSYSWTMNLSLPTSQFRLTSTSGDANISVSGNQIHGQIGSNQRSVFIISTPVQINVTKYPLFGIVISTSPTYSPSGGFAYGVRFTGILPNKTTVLLMNDAWPNEHMASGDRRQILIYLPNYGFSNMNITSVQIYGEERVSVSSSVQMRVVSMATYNYETKPGCFNTTLCYIKLSGIGGTNFYSLTTSVIATGNDLAYTVLFPFNDVFYASRPYSSGSSYVSIYSVNFMNGLQSLIPNNESNSCVFVFAKTGEINSLSFQSLKVSFTSSPSNAHGGVISTEFLVLTFVAEITLGFGLPILAILLLFKGTNWKIVFALGLFARLALTPWMAHSVDTTLWITQSSLYYHQGWIPTLYDPPAYFVYAFPLGAMSYYYLLGLDKIDFTIFYHFGGVIATTFVKLPFLILDIANMFLLFNVNPRPKILDAYISRSVVQQKLFGLAYFVNPFTIFVTSMWGQYESLTLFGLLLGYKLIGQRRLKEITGILGFLAAALSELSGFLVLPFYGFYVLLQKRFRDFLILILIVPIALVFIPSIREFLFSFTEPSSNRFLIPNVYSIISYVIPYNQLPLLISILATSIVVIYLLIRTHDFLFSIFVVVGVVISLNLFGGGHPQLMLLPLGLLYFYFAKLNDSSGALFLLGFGVIFTLTTIIGVQGFGYLLTGEGYSLFPQVEGRNHLEFFAFSSPMLFGILLLRTWRRDASPIGMLLASALLVISANFWVRLI